MACTHASNEQGHRGPSCPCNLQEPRVRRVSLGPDVGFACQDQHQAPAMCTLRSGNLYTFTAVATCTSTRPSPRERSRANTGTSSHSCTLLTSIRSGPTSFSSPACAFPPYAFQVKALAEQKAARKKYEAEHAEELKEQRAEEARERKRQAAEAARAVVSGFAAKAQGVVHHGSTPLPPVGCWLRRRQSTALQLVMPQFYSGVKWHGRGCNSGTTLHVLPGVVIAKNGGPGG